MFVLRLQFNFFRYVVKSPVFVARCRKFGKDAVEDPRIEEVVDDEVRVRLSGRPSGFELAPDNREGFVSRNERCGQVTSYVVT